MRANRTEGTPEEASTEGIEVRPHQIENTSVEFYDCAGQVDYGGMHQVFLTQRALFLLVWDITECSGRSVRNLDRVSYWKNDLRRRYYPLHMTVKHLKQVASNALIFTSRSKADFYGMKSGSG